jgi:uncharacterized protein YuzB (UPF0349 family)
MRKVSFFTLISVVWAFTIFSFFPFKVLAAGGKNCREILDELAKRHAGRFETVVAKFKEEALEGTNPARAFYILGIAYDIKGKVPEARNYYERSIQLQPNHNPATKFLNYLNGDEEACSVAEEKSAALVDASVITGVSPKELVQNFLRYKGETVLLEGWLLDKPAKKRGKNELICSTLSGSYSGGGVNMDGFFLLRTSSEIPSDRRITRGGKISVRGIVVDRDFLKNPTTKELSTDRKLVLDPLGIRVTNEVVQSGPLTLRLK